MSKYKAKGAVRTLKNYTKGYSDIQAKVRSATSNDPWGPNSTLMAEIAQATFNHHEFIEIMEMVDKRLNDHGKNWRHVFKALVLLDYCLHVGSQDVVSYAKENLYVVKTLREFQYIDDDLKDQGQNVRQRAKEITELLQDDERLQHERKQRTELRRRLTGNDDPLTDRSYNDSASSYERPSYFDEEADLRKAIEESKRSAQDYERRLKESEDDEELAKALRLSKEEEERRQEELNKKLEMSLLDLGPSGNNPFSQQTDLFGNNSQFGSSSNTDNKTIDFFDSIDNQQTAIPYMSQSQFIGNPNLIQQQQQSLLTDTYNQQHLSQFGLQTSNSSIVWDHLVMLELPVKPQDEKYASLANALGNRQDGMDTFGNIGNLRVPVGTGFANSSDPLIPRKSNSTGNIANQSNPFYPAESSSSLSLSPYSNSQQSSTLTNNNTLIDFSDSGSISSNQFSKNPFQIQQPANNNNSLNKPKTLNEIQFSQNNTLITSTAPFSITTDLFFDLSTK
ncbi:9216_t:CDS:10 [Entrophospora sp. SA101]|nr:6904_t:CDS:10 [Entrophospora sp. SA101]CAJ0650799.1 4459_t:CDS:10 [Entrophospora sp. SA101]CAJ0768101.1 9216_t:CDS:10 [Entrophospora sp. SA101]CAJ0894043.1 11247_t:CDS:10 [Entrophospora sp. SA101]CAJ0923741.1 6319_t:CDS:10 [Entrophospora sp. SA101]